MHYIYAILYSPSYRHRFGDAVRDSFPRVPVAGARSLSSDMVALGADLVALHLLEDEYPSASWNVSRPKGRSPLKTLMTKFAGKGDAEVAVGYPRHANGNVYINPSRHFEGVPENVWNFHIGGYQVCEKWLKDRRGRTLSDEEITHYQRVVVALNETIRLMAEIDKVIEAHGGWPGAFVTKSNA
jgi:predicted helicase